MSKPLPYFVGVDDGHYETKITESNASFRIASQAKAGTMNQISIHGGGMSVYPYTTSEGDFVIGDIDELDSTAFDDYPKSALNRVIVSHALAQLNLDPTRPIYACSGLPLRRFYKGGELNKELIRAKSKNLLMNDVISKSGVRIPRIVKHEVIAEGVAAWMDLVFSRDSSGALVRNMEIAKQKIAIIDIGGRTTDIAVIKGGNLDKDRSTTIDEGMLTVRGLVSEAIRDKYDIKPNVAMLNQVIENHTIKLWGKTESVEEIMIASQKQVLSRIHNECLHRLGSAADIDEVVFVGGSVMKFRNYIDNWFRQQRISDSASMANSNGMQKYAEFIMSSV